MPKRLGFNAGNRKLKTCAQRLGELQEGAEQQGLFGDAERRVEIFFTPNAATAPMRAPLI
jgi:hypothetical protein